MPFYFAYGSSLLRAQMERRLMGNRPHTRARLRGYRLAFMGHSLERKGAVVNLVPDPTRYVPGTLYELDEVMIQYLDRAEAVEKGTYQPLDVEVEMDDGNKIRAAQLPAFRPDRPPRATQSGLFNAGQAGLPGMGTTRRDFGRSALLQVK